RLRLVPIGRALLAPSFSVPAEIIAVENVFPVEFRLRFPKFATASPSIELGRLTVLEIVATKLLVSLLAPIKVPVKLGPDTPPVTVKLVPEMPPIAMAPEPLSVIGPLQVLLPLLA